MFAGFGSLPVGNLSFAFQQSGISGQSIVVILFASSIFVWAIMLTKFHELSLARKMSQKFLSSYRKETHPLGLFLKHQKFEGSSLYKIYEQVAVALGTTMETRGVDQSRLFMGNFTDETRKLGESDIQYVRNIAERTLADETMAMDDHMAMMATVTTAAPLLGLLGTVWGLLSAFAQMTISGGAMLSAVAPGISAALLTTVAGLVVAIPSTVGYNLISSGIRRSTISMEAFTDELLAEIDRQYRKA